MKVLFLDPVSDFNPVRHGFYFTNNSLLVLEAYLEQYH